MEKAEMRRGKYGLKKEIGSWGGMRMEEIEGNLEEEKETGENGEIKKNVASGSIENKRQGVRNGTKWRKGIKEDKNQIWEGMRREKREIRDKNNGKKE